VRIGVKTLDSMLDGGLPRKSLTLVAGEPGTGKTILSAHFILKGTLEGERGLYVTFSEEKAAFIENLAAMGLPFHEMENKNAAYVMDLLTVREEGLNSAFELILRRLEDTDTKRLVIDSFSVISQIFGEKINARIMLHSILRRILREMECTTIIISEGEDIRGSMESYVSDGVLLLRKKELDGRQFRELEIAKMRGTAA